MKAAQTVDAPEQAGIPFMVVGSFSSNVVQAGRLDLDHIRRWTDEHGTREILEKLLSG